MNAIVSMVWAVMAGCFLSIGVIVFTQLIGDGADLLGFTKWTFRYYIVCLGVCLSLLVISRPARKRWVFMMFFFVAVIMVLGIGFESFVGTSGSGGEGPVAQMRQDMLAMAMTLAKVVMYVAPGALTAFYAFVAFDGASRARAQKPS